MVANSPSFEAKLVRGVRIHMHVRWAFRLLLQPWKTNTSTSVLIPVSETRQRCAGSSWRACAPRGGHQQTLQAPPAPTPSGQPADRRTDQLLLRPRQRFRFPEHGQTFLVRQSTKKAGDSLIPKYISRDFKTLSDKDILGNLDLGLLTTDTSCYRSCGHGRCCLSTLRLSKLIGNTSGKIRQPGQWEQTYVGNEK